MQCFGKTSQETVDWPEKQGTLKRSTPIKVLGFAFKPLIVNINLLGGVAKWSEHFMHSSEFVAVTINAWMFSHLTLFW